MVGVDSDVEAVGEDLLGVGGGNQEEEQEAGGQEEKEQALGGGGGGVDGEGGQPFQFAQKFPD
jgi:hypothetical protein